MPAQPPPTIATFTRPGLLMVGASWYTEILSALLGNYLAEVKEVVLAEMRDIVPARRYRDVLYGPMLEYPMRSGKGLRPALCIATCRAIGGRLEDVLRTAAVIELYHNAFLIHDDIEDGSLVRRGLPTLHREYGVPAAINIGDAMLALALRPLLDNTRSLGLGKALRILDYIARMAIESAEGQALELDWVRSGCWDLRDADYWHLVYKKTCWYTFIAPVFIAAVIAGLDLAKFSLLRKFAIYLGVSFQIQDDILNLEADEQAYGKEIGGDLVEGKRTLILLHAMRTAPTPAREAARAILAKAPGTKSLADVQFLQRMLRDVGSLDYARRVAGTVATKAGNALATVSGSWSPSVHLDFLRSLVDYVVLRDR